VFDWLFTDRASEHSQARLVEFEICQRDALL
jgi:hypothetical protein